MNFTQNLHFEDGPGVLSC